MELLNVIRAQSVWLFDPNDLNPRGKNFLPELIDWLRAKYNFQQVPTGPSDLDETKGLAFKLGEFQLGSERLAIELKIYTDGVIANTYSSTQATDKFLDGVLTSIAQEFGLKYEPSIIRSKTYLSELTVRLHGSFSNLANKLTPFSTRLTSTLNSKFEVGGISFWTDSFTSAIKPSAFSVERKVNAPFSENRYYARASAQTDTHLELLKDFEQLLSSD